MRERMFAFVYVGTVAELPSLSWAGDDRTEAFEGIQRLSGSAMHGRPRVRAGRL